MPQNVIDKLGPCGLHCGGCLAFRGGPIQQHAEALRNELGPNFAAYAERFRDMDPVFEDYPAFARMLDYLAQGLCTGCRGSGCLFKECRLPECAREHEVDFCFQCAEFPCDRHGMPENLAKVWQRNNERMKTEGVRNFYYWIKNKPRYP